jgi:FixJ family two-component response regulator
MPDMSGFDLMQQLREDGAPIPTILVTGRTDASIRVRAMELGAVALLEKPVEYSELLVAIERALDPGR